MLTNAFKVTSTSNNKIQIKVLPGHFATSHSHINYYLDMTRLKVGQREAKEVASTMAQDYQYNKPVDSIICMDGCHTIGAYLAEQLSDAGVMSMNAHQSIYIIEPEFDPNGQMIFRDNIQPMKKKKNIVLLLASATTGKTIARSLECIEYYGGIIQGISAIFSAANAINDIPIHSTFHTEDFTSYQSYSHHDCPFCQSGQKIDAIVNNFGYSQL